MKIILEKVTVYPPHAIGRADVRLILSSLPAAWTENIRLVRLSASRSSHVALFFRHGGKLSISSRGFSKKQTLELILMELAARARGFKSRTFQNLPECYESEIRNLVTPLVEELLPKLLQEKIWLDQSEEQRKKTAVKI